MIDEYEDDKYDGDYKKDIYENSTFAVYDKKMMDLE